MTRLIFDFDNTIAKTSWHAIKKVWPSFVQKDWPEKQKWLEKNAGYFLSEALPSGFYTDKKVYEVGAMEDAKHSLHNRMLPFFEENLGWNFEPIAQNKVESGIILKLFYTPNFYDDLKVGEGTNIEYDSMMEVMEYARSKGWLLCFCTNRRSDSFKLAEDWLLYHGIVFDEMIKVNTFDKGHIFADNDEVQNIFIDDKPECMEGKHKGKILFGNYLYQNDGGITDDMVRAANWVEAAKVIKNFN